MAKRREETPAPGSPAWMATFSDLMNLLLCFFVLLFSMSTISEEKLKEVAASMNQTFSIWTAGASAIGDGILISNGVSQLNELDQYINSTGTPADSTTDSEEVNEYENLAGKVEEMELEQMESMAEQIAEAIGESQMEDEIDMTFTSQFIQLTLSGSILFDPGEVTIRDESKPVLEKVGMILERYADGIIEIEGHTDNVPNHDVKYVNNDELSAGRALSVFNYFMETTNLDPSIVKHAGRGEYVPVADNSTAEGRAKNRRVEIRIYRSEVTN
ncbi:MAG: flagellar motor protein MotB [Lachnospiraceae bacterium]|nr:flagellar motor protein MotB [Lachnospiraceae bacterium]